MMIFTKLSIIIPYNYPSLNCIQQLQYIFPRPKMHQSANKLGHLRGELRKEKLASMMQKIRYEVIEHHQK